MQTISFKLSEESNGLPTSRPYGTFFIDGVMVAVPIFSIASATHFLTLLRDRIPGFNEISVEESVIQVREVGIPETISGADLLVATGISPTQLPKHITLESAESKLIALNFERVMQQVGLMPAVVAFKVCPKDCFNGAPHGYLYIGIDRIPIYILSITQGVRLFELLKRDKQFSKELSGIEFAGAVETSLHSFGLPFSIKNEAGDRDDLEMKYDLAGGSMSSSELVDTPNDLRRQNKIILL
jgi:hypothetical protein